MPTSDRPRREAEGMCDFVSGEVLLSFPEHPGANEAMSRWFDEHGEETHVRVLEMLDRRLKGVRVPSDARLSIQRQVWLVQVPPGQEIYKCNFLRQEYQRALIEANVLNDDRERAAELLLDVWVEPNLMLTLADGQSSYMPPDSNQVLLGPIHEEYKRLVGVRI